jgi:DNA-binding response OmpR family regulator
MKLKISLISRLVKINSQIYRNKKAEVICGKIIAYKNYCLLRNFEMMMKIVIADDNKDLLDLLKLSLSGDEFDVAIMSSKRQLLSHLGKHTPAVLFLDVFFDNADGRELCKEIKATVKNKLNIIIMSANPYAMEKYKSFGANDYLKKPFSAAELLQKIRNLTTKNVSSL